MHQHRTFFLSFPMFVLVVSACAVSQVSPATSQATQPISPSPATVSEAKPSGQILFVSERDGNTEIYVISADGGEGVNLTRDPAKDFSASWSPDGQRIAFLSDRTGKVEIFVMEADGSNLLQLTDDPDGEGWWPPARRSPDGGRLLAVRGVTSIGGWGQSRIEVVQADGSGWHRLYGEQETANNDLVAEWLPSGNQVDFLSFRYTTNAVFTVPTIGGSPGGLFINGHENVTAFAGSPSGEQVALVTYFPDPAYNYHTALHLLTREGLREMAVPDAAHLDPFGDFNLAWSPAGDRIAFPATALRGHRELWVWFVAFPGDLDQKLMTMTDLGGVHGRPTWSGDGEWVAFGAEVHGDEEIYVVRVGLAPMTAGATALLRLTSSEGRDYDPAWRP